MMFNKKVLKMVSILMPAMILNSCSGDSGNTGAGTTTTTVENHIVFFNSCTVPCNSNVLYKYSSATNAITSIAEGSLNVEADYGPGQNINLVFNEKYYFAADDGINGSELWVYDYTQPEQVGVNPKLVMDINVGVSGSFPYNFITFENKIYFSASTAAEGRELWVYDPEAAIASGQNPKIIFDSQPGINGISPRYMTVLNNKIYTQGSTVNEGVELWVYDPNVAGSVSNPQIVRDIYAGSGSSNPKNLIAVNNKLYFKAYNISMGNELHVYDPALPVSGTNPDLVYDLTPGLTQGDFEDPVALDNKIYFRGQTPSTGRELFVFDTTLPASGTNPQIVYDINAANSSPYELTVSNGKIYFVADSATAGSELFSYDPAEVSSPTNPLLLDIVPGATGSDVGIMVQVGEKLYMSIWVNSTNKFISYNQTEAFSPGTNPVEKGTQIFDDSQYDLVSLTYTTTQ